MNDTGIFISKLTPGGAAERAGLKVGDKILEVNGAAMNEQRHDFAVQCIQKPVDIIEMLVVRDQPKMASTSSLANGLAQVRGRENCRVG